MQVEKLVLHACALVEAFTVLLMSGSDHFRNKINLLSHWISHYMYFKARQKVVEKIHTLSCEWTVLPDTVDTVVVSKVSCSNQLATQRIKHQETLSLACSNEQGPKMKEGNFKVLYKVAVGHRHCIIVMQCVCVLKSSHTAADTCYPLNKRI